MKVVHVITGLSTGGAEMALLKLLSHMDRAEFQPEIVSLTNVGVVGESIRALGIPVRSLGMSRGVPNPLFVLRLARMLRDARPDLVQTWMYHADLVGGLAAKLTGNLPVVWNVRHSYLEPHHTKRTTFWTARACARLSGHVPQRIVCAAEVSRRAHEALGYDAKRMVVIPNGFDLSKLRPDPEARRAVREELDIPEDAPLVGLVARFHPDKDHRNFVRAAAILHAQRPGVRFLMCGEGITRENGELTRWVEDAGIGEYCYLLGRRDDVTRINAALDVATSSSGSEGFPNVVGEAMACGVPCVVTDVGDSAAIVGGTGMVVPRQDHRALAEGWAKLLEMGAEERRTLGEKARRRVEERYSLDSVVAAYTTLYRTVVEESRQGSSA